MKYRSIERNPSCTGFRFRPAALASAALVAVSLGGCATLTATSHGSYAVAAQRALEYLPDEETFDWIDPETEQVSRLTVLDTNQDETGRYCRKLTYQASPDAEDASESYCRDAETGTWVFNGSVTD